ncbi:MAG TPA: cytochrome b/b6 domain-containing protein [Burkholderiaceae bacterium]|nr:cytochrome b/b6 domain-containing protein [Burkholderiaceae bacterium]
MSAPARGRVRIWDLPTRLFHWLLAGLVLAAWASGQFGGQPWLEWHFRFGYAVLLLLVFRLFWGFAGDRYARFASFAPSMRAALGYLRSPRPWAGHSPLGALSVYALLIGTGVQVLTGLLASDGDFTEGPWAVLVSESSVKLASSIHRFNRWVLLALILMHLAAVAWHTMRRRDALVRAMVSGDREGIDAAAATDDRRMRLRAVVFLALSAALVAYAVTL